VIGQGRLGVGIGLLALLTGGMVGAAAPVHAAGIATISCTGWSYTTYSPGLTNTVQPHTVSVDGDLGLVDEHSPTATCVSVGTAATAGERDVTAQLTLGCNQLLTETGVETVAWNDGRSTSFQFTATVAHTAAAVVLTETGTVISGEFLGEHVVETFTAPNTALLACATPAGVTSLDYATVLTILPL
jgi:hypothetical protein